MPLASASGSCSRMTPEAASLLDPPSVSLSGSLSESESAGSVVADICEASDCTSCCSNPSAAS